MRKIVFWILCFLPILAFAAVPVVRDGVPAAQIVLTAEAGDSGPLAAEELQHWIKEISGAELPIVKQMDTSKARIVLKRDPSLKLKADGFIISEPMKGKEILVAAPGTRGLLAGVWKLLFLNTDIIWARPNPEYGTIFTPKKTLVFDKTTFQYDPVFVLRGFQYTGYFKDEEIWQARNGNNFSVNMVHKGKFQKELYDSGYCFFGAHNLIRLYMPEKKYWNTHPEFYALMNGQRIDPSKKTYKTNLCYTNKECQQEFLKNFQEIVRKNLQYDTIGLCQEDNLDTCECPECIKPIKLANGKVLTVKDKNFQSTRFFLWLTPMAEWLQKEYPDKKIKTNAYFLTEPAPGCKLPKNVNVSFAPIYKNGRYPITHPINKDSLAKFHSWTSTGADLRWREYYGLVGEFPRPADKVMAVDLQYAVEKEIQTTLSEMRHDRPFLKWDGQYTWDQNAMYFYVMAHLHENPYRPVEELRNEFLTRVYGEAAPYVKEYYALTEKAWMQYPRWSLHNDNAQAIWKFCLTYDPSLKGKLATLLAKAKSCKMHPNGRKILERLAASFEKRSNAKNPVVTVQKAQGKVDFSDPLFETGAWKTAPAMANFLPDERAPKITPPTLLKLLHDDTNLYVAFRCTDHNGKKVFAQNAGSYRDKWLPGNKVEVFFTTYSGTRIQLIVDSNGNIMDVLGTKESWDQFFNIPVHKDDDGWSTMFTVPLSLLGADLGKDELPFYANRYYSNPEKNVKLFFPFLVNVPVHDTLIFPVLKLVPTAAEIVAQQKLPDCALNGSFAKLNKQETAAAHWDFWKRKDSKSEVKFETNDGINGSTTAVLSGGEGSLFSHIKIQPREKIYARVKVKRNGKGTAHLTLRFQEPDRKWLKPVCRKNIVAKDGEWVTVEITGIAPDGAGLAVPILESLNAPEGTIRYTQFELYRIPVQDTHPIKEENMQNQKSKSALTSLALACTVALNAAPPANKTQPVSPTAEIVVQQNLPDCALNGSFAKLNKQGTAAANWDFWKRNDSKAKVVFEKKGGVDGSTAAVLSGGECNLFSHIKVQPKEKVLARVRVKTNGKGTASLTLRFQTPNRKWLKPISSKAVVSKDGEWVTVEVTGTAPEGAGLAVPILEWLKAPEGTVRYSKFQLYRIPATVPQKTPANVETSVDKKMTDYALNGSFEKLNKQGTAAANWDFWKRNNSKGKVVFEKNGGVDGSTAAVLSGGECSLFSHIKVQPKEKVLARVRVKTNGKGTASLTLRFQTPNRKWLKPISSKAVVSKDGEWVTVEVTGTAPEGAGLAVPILEWLKAPEGTVRYSKFELYRIPATAPQKTPANVETSVDKKMTDYALNGSFAKLNKQGTAAANWDFWKRNNSKGKVVFEKNGGVDGSTAAVLSGGECSLFSHIKVQPKEKVLARVRVKTNGKGTASLTLRFQTPNRKWLKPISSKAVISKDGEWVTVEVTGTAPEGAGLAVPILEWLKAPEGTVRYSKFELYRIPTL